MTAQQFAKRFSLDDWQTLCGNLKFLDAVERGDFGVAEGIVHRILTGDNSSEFYRGFCEATGLNPMDADAQWAGFSVQLPDAERRRIERGGYASGCREGALFKKAFPPRE